LLIFNWWDAKGEGALLFLNLICFLMLNRHNSHAMGRKQARADTGIPLEDTWDRRSHLANSLFPPGVKARLCRPQDERLSGECLDGEPERMEKFSVTLAKQNYLNQSCCKSKGRFCFTDASERVVIPFRLDEVNSSQGASPP